MSILLLMQDGWIEYNIYDIWAKICNENWENLVLKDCFVKLFLQKASFSLARGRKNWSVYQDAKKWVNFGSLCSQFLL